MRFHDLILEKKVSIPWDGDGIEFFLGIVGLGSGSIG